MKPSFRTVLASVLVLALAALFVRLGFWQLDRLEGRRARNEAWRTQTAAPPLVLDSATASLLRADPERYVNRRVRASGTYEPDGEVVLRGRAHGGKPGVHLATPLRVPAAGTAVMVNRGWAPSPDGARVDASAYAEPGSLTVEGVLQAVPRTDDGGAPSMAGQGAGAVRTHRRLDLDALRRDRPDLLPLYIQQLPDADSARAPLKRVPPPPLTDGPHLGYAIQWFSFATIAVVGLAILLLRGRKH